MLNPCSVYGFTATLGIVATLLQPTAAIITVDLPQLNSTIESNFSARSESVATDVSTTLDLDKKNFTIHRYAALGDSYATGVGCGKRIAYRWSRYDHAYAYLLNNDIRKTPWKRRKDRKEKTFQFRARIGHKTGEVANKQLRRIKGQVDAMTITVGGNDIGFGPILNSCVYGWLKKPLTKCYETLDRSFEQMKELGPKLDIMIAKATEKLTPDTGRLYLTGYGQMFDASTTQCDTVSWHVWGKKNAKPLTQERREKFNEVARLLNGELAAAAERAGHQVVFVDIDPYISMCHARFCESGVQEPAFKRKELGYFGLKGPDSGMASTSRDRENITALHSRHISAIIPDRILKTVHPRSNAHRMMADLILWHMEAEKAKYLGLELPPRPGREVCRASGTIKDRSVESDLAMTEEDAELMGQYIDKIESEWGADDEEDDEEDEEDD